MVVNLARSYTLLKTLQFSGGIFSLRNQLETVCSLSSVIEKERNVFSNEEF